MDVTAFLDNLQDVAGSPYAFVAYIAVLLAWVYTTVARHRLGKIAGALKDLPENDRSKVLLKEYSTSPREGLSAEDWIRSRRHMMVFLAFLSLMICVTLVLIIALVLTIRPAGDGPQGSGGEADVRGMMGVYAQRILILEERLKATEDQAKALKAQLVQLSREQPDERLVTMLGELHQVYSPADPRILGVLYDSALSGEDKVTTLSMMMVRKLDQDIDSQARYINFLQSAERHLQMSDISTMPAPSIDLETMKLKRMIDKREQLFDRLRQIIDKYNQTAKSIIDEIGR